MVKEINIEQFIKDAEKCCFDCRVSSVNLTIIAPGISLCPKCLNTVKENYPEINIVKFNGKFSWIYYLNNELIHPNDLVEYLAKKIDIKIIQEGDGTKEQKDQ